MMAIAQAGEGKNLRRSPDLLLPGESICLAIVRLEKQILFLDRADPRGIELFLGFAVGVGFLDLQAILELPGGNAGLF